MPGAGAHRAAVAVWAGALAGALGWATAAAAPPATGRVLPGTAPGAGFAQALESRPFVFPRDHGPHPQYRQEWWYVTGNLDAASGERFGFELTFFRFALAPLAAAGPAATAGADMPGAPGATPGETSAWRTREMYMAHFAITDVARRRFRFAQKLSRAALGLAGAQGPPLRVWIDDWSLAGIEPAPTPAALAPWTLHAAQDGYEIELTLEPLTAPVPNGAAGLSRKSAEPSAANYYYSVPRLKVRGRLLRDDRPLEVHGLAWLDREWGSGGLAAEQAGWDWFALQLSDGGALMFYALRDRDGRRDPWSAGTWIAPTGEARPLANADVAIAVTDSWRNAQGVRYPAAWRIEVPALALSLAVRPVLPDQELKTTPHYWEGAVDAGGERSGESVSGRGYVELVGYAPER
jgi:predicted secreted hydrolase